MAKVESYAGDFDKLETETWDEYRVRTELLMDTLWKQSDNLTDGEVVKGIISFPVADGSAFYMVLKEKPLRLMHIPYMDAWEASDITIRGLNLSDVKLILKRNKSLHKLKPMLHIPSVEEAKEALVNKKVIAQIEMKLDVAKRFNLAVDDAQCAFWGVIADRDSYRVRLAPLRFHLDYRAFLLAQVHERTSLAF